MVPRGPRIVLALACALAALALGAGGGATAPAPAGSLALVREGRQLFGEGCSSCHGADARGVRGVGPSLRGVGALSADFYLRTGRMPLDDPHKQPVRADPPYNDRQIRALVAYVGSFGGPPIPAAHPGRGDLSAGQRLYTEHCAGCHQAVGQGGIAAKGVAPDLRRSKPIDVAEAVEVGPYVMPRFRKQLSRADVDSIARYVEWTRHPDDRGGWGIGHIGPVPEGMVAWLLAGTALLLVIRLIGERTGP